MCIIRYRYGLASVGSLPSRQSQLLFFVCPEQKNNVLLEHSRMVATPQMVEGRGIVKVLPIP